MSSASAAVSSDPDLLHSAFTYLKSRLVGRRFLLMVLAVLLMLAAGWLANRPAILLGEIVDSVIDRTATSFAEIFPVISIIAMLLVSREITIWLRKYCVERVSTAVEKEEFVSAIQMLFTVEMSVLIGERAGALNVRIHRSIEGVVRLLKLLFLDFLPNVVVAFVAFYMAASRAVYLAFVMLGVAVLGGFTTAWQVRSQKGIRIHLFRAKEDLGAKVVELLNGIDYVRVSGAVKHEGRNSEELAEYLRQREFRHHFAMMSFDFLKQLIEASGFVIVIGMGSWMAAEGQISPGEVLTFALLFNSVAIPLRELHRVVDEGFEASMRVHDLLDLYALPRDGGLDGSIEPFLPDDRAEPMVTCRGLTVGYHLSDGSKAYPLKKLDFTAYAGEVIGIAGPSGSGKSTLVKVLMGLVPNYGGSVKVFGSETRDLRKSSLARLIAYVPQSSFLVKGTIKANVLYGSEDGGYSDEDIWTALCEAKLKEFVQLAPEGLLSEIAEQGRNLSGGERQRLMLARVFLKRAHLIILDEATSALDSVNERLVQQSIERLVSGRTALIIAHRLSTLRFADRIVVFKDGQIIEDGSYEELVSTKGEFYHLVQQEKAESIRKVSSLGGM